MSTPINDRDRDGIDDRRQDPVVMRDGHPVNDDAVASNNDRTVANEPTHTDDRTVANEPARTDDRVVASDRDARDERVEREEVVVEESMSRHDVVAREKEQFGGIKFGSAFFGWLAATGMAALLTALAAGTGAALGLGVDDATDASGTIGIVGAILLLVILFVAYYCGGYVAGRMARFNGFRQGIAVWLWALVIAIVVAIIGAIAGPQFNILANLNTFPRIPIAEGDLTTVGIITAVVVALASLVGAVLGGMAGMRFHRKVDRAGLGD